MESKQCNNCGNPFQDWAQFCSSCGELRENYSKPAGFWIRVVAHIVDFLVFIPIIAVGTWNQFALQSTALMLLLSLPGILYRPFMHAFFGATVGKMACRIRVINENGEKLSLLTAYIRNIPFLAQALVALAGQLILFSSEEFQSASSFMEIAQMQQQQGIGPLDIVTYLLILVVLIDCVVAAFSYRKRALHDMLAGSFCVYKNP